MGIKSRIKSLLTANSNKKPKNTVFNDDVFIVSYPKSGNTWVRFILANLIHGRENLITFHSAKKFIPDFEVHHEDIEMLSRPRILKSHSEFDKRFRKVIYIVRDVRDVYISYYNYQLKKISDKDISEFIRRIDAEKSGWSSHVETWINSSSAEILVVKYEDMLDDTETEVRRIISFLGLDIENEALINDAIEKSAFDQMKTIEEKYGRPFLNENDKEKSSTFVRSGKKEQWKFVLSEEDIGYLVNKHKIMLDKLGYLDSN